VLTNNELPCLLYACRKGGDLPMTKDPAYHTDSPEYPPTHRAVYHDYNACPEGKKIESKHRKAGNGGKLRCDECKKLDSK